MRKEDLVLAIIVLVAVLSGGLLARELQRQQAVLAASRPFVSQAPLGGFHKFASDVYWMLFLQYAGANQITKSNAPEFERRVKQIITMDPDFTRIYKLGALMLAPVDQKAALAILDQGIKNPRLRDGWQLPLLAGQLIMRKQWDHYYAKEPLDMTAVENARDKFLLALSRGAPPGLALNSYIRADAALKNNHRPREINELESWFQLYKREHLRGTGGNGGGRGRGGRGGRGGSILASLEDGSTQAGIPEEGPPFSLTDRLVTAMRTAKQRNPDDEDLSLMIREIRSVVFNNARFNELTMEPIDTSKLNSFSGLIETPRAKTYIVALSPSAGFSVMGFTSQTSSGEASVAVRVNGVPVKGLERIPVGPKRSTAFVLSGGVLNAGQTLDLVVTTPAEGTADLAYTIEVYQNR